MSDAPLKRRSVLTCAEKKATQSYGWPFEWLMDFLLQQGWFSAGFFFIVGNDDGGGYFVAWFQVQ
jgi:hypothetical protein